MPSKVMRESGGPRFYQDYEKVSFMIADKSLDQGTSDYDETHYT